MNISPINNTQPNFKAKFKDFPAEWIKPLKLEAMTNEKTFEYMKKFDEMQKNIEVEIRLLPGINNYKLRNILTEVITEPLTINSLYSGKAFETFFTNLFADSKLLKTPTEENLKNFNDVMSKLISK